MPNWLNNLVATKRRRWLLAILIGFVVFSAASVEVSSRSFFCNSCHIMKPYYASWKIDPHSDVGCVQCHIAPGAGNLVHAKLDGLAQTLNDVLHRSATKPSANVSDFACTRAGCHVTGELGKPANKQLTYHFDHAAHLDMEYLGIAVHCTTCHSFIKGDAHFSVNTNVCFSCHLMTSYESELAHAPDHPSRGLPLSTLTNHAPPPTTLVAPSSCDTCHDPPQQRIAYNGLTIDHAEYLSYGASCQSCHKGVTSPPPPIDDSRCLNCHGFGVERLLPMEELHRVHVEGRHKVECFHCHGLIQHGTLAESMSLEHFDCRSCHADQHQLQRSVYLRQPIDNGQPLERMPVSPMFLAHVPCTGCHIELRDVSTRPGSGALVAGAVPAACDNCHQPGLGEQMIPLWQRTTRDLYNSTKELIASVRDRSNPDVARLIHEAQQVLEIVRLDGSWGVHNPRYTQDLIEQAQAKALEARAIERNQGGPEARR
jgi:nitrate/TMAO reductase-like tetraheme cytochrome c subunit